MAKKIDISLINKIEEGLNSQEEWQLEVNFHELVKLTFFAIDTAVKRKASWEAIAQSIQESIGSEVEINPNTLRQYYFYFKSHPEALPKKKRRTGDSKKKQRSDTQDFLTSAVKPGSSNRSDKAVQLLAEASDNQVKKTEEEITETLLPEPKEKLGSNFAY